MRRFRRRVWPARHLPGRHLRPHRRLPCGGAAGMSADHRDMQTSLILALAEPFPPEVPVGSEILLRVRALGAARDLRGGRIEIIAGEDVIASAGLAPSGDDFSATASLAVEAPDTVGAFTWTIRFPPQEIDGVAYGE